MSNTMAIPLFPSPISDWSNPARGPQIQESGKQPAEVSLPRYTAELRKLEE